MRYATTIRITKSDPTTLTVNSPYHPDFPSQAKTLGGRWDARNKAWVFDVRDEQQVRDLYIRVYGTDGSNAADVVTIRVTTGRSQWEAERAGLFLCGRQIARASGRDSGARLGDGVVVEAGKLTSGGSKQYWKTIAKPGTIFLLRDVPRAAVEVLGADLPSAIAEFEMIEEHIPTPSRVDPTLADEVAALISRHGFEQVQVALHAYQPPKPTAREWMTCRHCGQSGYTFNYPFSTLGEGICDDCL